MTIQEANQIHFDCYHSTDYGMWDRYTPEQREMAIQIRQQEHDRQRGCWGTWNISDRH